MTATKQQAVRIALGGNYLDATQIRQAKNPAPSAVALLSFRESGTRRA